MKYLIALTILLVPASAALAENEGWYKLGDIPTGTKVYIRSTDMQKGNSSSTAAKVWVKMDHSNDQTTDLTETKFLFEINCLQQTYETLSTITLTQGESQPRVKQTPYGERRYIAPDTTIEQVAKDVCSNPQ